MCIYAYIHTHITSTFLSFSSRSNCVLGIRCIENKYKYVYRRKRGRRPYDLATDLSVLELNALSQIYMDNGNASRMNSMSIIIVVMLLSAIV